MPRQSHVRVYFSPEVAEAILDRMAAGEPLLRICGPGRGAGMPDRQTIYHWLRKDAGFLRAYLLARRLGAQALAEEIVEIADGRAVAEPQGRGHRASFGRQVPGELPVVRSVEEGRNLGRDWMRITARRWLAGVMAPRGGEDRALLEAVGEANPPPAMDDLERGARIAAILEAARRRKLEIEGRDAHDPACQDPIEVLRTEPAFIATAAEHDAETGPS